MGDWSIEDEGGFPATDEDDDDDSSSFGGEVNSRADMKISSVSEAAITSKRSALSIYTT